MRVPCFRPASRLLRPGGWLLPALLLLGPLLPAQYLNRAVYLGRGEEGIRRNFAQNTEYFLDRFSYVLNPPWWDPDPAFLRRGARMSLGSVSSKEFTVEGSVEIEARAGKGFIFRAHTLQSENQDTRFLRNALELEYRISRDFGIFTMIEGVAEKSEDDWSFGLRISPRSSSELRLTFTSVDLPDEKAQNTFYEEKPFGLMLSGYAGEEEGANLRFEIGSQLPFRQRFEDTAERFEMQRHLGSMEARFPLSASDWLLAGLDLEYGLKRLRPDAPAGLLAEKLRRDMETLRLELWHRFPGDLELSGGLIYLHKEEDGRRPNDPAEDLRLLRREWMFLARARIPLGRDFFFEPHIFAGEIRFEERQGSLRSQDRRGFEGKLGLPLLFRFSDEGYFLVNVSLELDEVAFGGGQVAFGFDF